MMSDFIEPAESIRPNPHPMISHNPNRAHRRRAARRPSKVRQVAAARAPRGGRRAGGVRGGVRLVIRIVARAAAAVRRLLWEVLGVLRAVGARVLRATGARIEIVLQGGGRSGIRPTQHQCPPTLFRRPQLRRRRSSETV